jgi:hypothetical protein
VSHLDEKEGVQLSSNAQAITLPNRGAQATVSPALLHSNFPPPVILSAVSSLSNSIFIFLIFSIVLNFKIKHFPPIDRDISHVIFGMLIFNTFCTLSKDVPYFAHAKRIYVKLIHPEVFCCREGMVMLC